MPPATSAIEVKGLAKIYGRLKAVDGVDSPSAQRRDLRHGRPERRRQDDDHRMPRRPALRRRRGDPRPGPRSRRGRPRALAKGSASSSRRAPCPSDIKVWEALDLFASFYANPVPWEPLLEQLGPLREAQRPFPQTLRRPEAAALHRPGPGQRPGPRLPRRADDRASIPRPAGPCGISSGPSAARQDRLPDHPLHGGGRAPLRPGRRSSITAGIVALDSPANLVRGLGSGESGSCSPPSPAAIPRCSGPCPASPGSSRAGERIDRLRPGRPLVVDVVNALEPNGSSSATCAPNSPTWRTSSWP